MDKDGMYVVHDVVDDYPDLASTAIGDLEERHVVVYRVGHHPEGAITFPLPPGCTLLHTTVLHSTLPHSTLLYSTALHSTFHYIISSSTSLNEESC